ncbi:MAG: MBL fold metallo-hydrolase [Beijerinckiaceae bacterium]|nr:MBL fold metallo-hydrolase [Beijerinckiaceae bacterium]
MHLDVWGARGSHPASGMAFSRFGHHTACLSVRSGDHLLVLDAGTGATALARALEASPPRAVDILLSHFHHDHVMGLPYLLMSLPAETDLRIHAAPECGLGLEALVAAILSPPYFPAGIAGVLGRTACHQHAAGAAFEAGALQIRMHPLEHPGGSTAFRVSDGARSLVYATDLEEPEQPDSAWVAFARGADLLVHDTMFTESEREVRRGWGHATIAGALQLADAAHVARLVGFHHNPVHDDELMSQREQELARVRPGSGLAREGESLPV